MTDDLHPAADGHPGVPPRTAARPWRALLLGAGFLALGALLAAAVVLLLVRLATLG